MKRSIIVTALLGVLVLPGSAQKTLPEMRGIPMEKKGEDLSEWGVGDSFEDIFEYEEVSASSSLKPSGINRYDAEMAHDNNLKTAWVEGVRGDGVGSWLEYRLTPIQSEGTDRAITGLTIFNGYRKTQAAWKENGRIKRLRIEVDGKPYGTILLADTPRYQSVNIGRIPLVRNKKVLLRFVILSVYPGTKHRDTALTELGFEGTGIY
ncbi:MAG: hypothetical protein H8F28_26105 [Fibrella sp.]|nr:hypothetical protein [Armatimonadota bacterium]